MVRFPSFSMSLAVGMLLVLGGCSANFHTAFRKIPLEEKSRSLVALDAKQRTIIVNESKSCAEPSPDVFAVIAQSLSAGGSFSKSVDPASLEAALNVAFGSAEQGSTIPRTQTVNMLREMMYRTCERALNGGISSLEMPIQAVRDQRLMVSILAIEQLTGAVTPRPVGIGATGAAAQASGEAIIRLDEAHKEVDASTAATLKAQSDYDNLNEKVDANSDERVCDMIAAAVKEGKDLTDDQKEKQPSCSNAATVLADAKARQARAREHETDLRRMATTLGGSVSTATSIVANGGIDRAGDADVAQVAEAIREIVKSNFSDSTEFMLFCLKSMDPGQVSDEVKEKISAFQPECANFLQASFIAKANEAQMLAAKTQLEEARITGRLLAQSNDTFARYWPSLRPQLTDDTKRRELASELKQDLATEEEKADCFAAADTKEKANACFLGLPNSARRKLVTGE